MTVEQYFDHDFCAAKAKSRNTVLFAYVSLIEYLVLLGSEYLVTLHIMLKSFIQHADEGRAFQHTGGLIQLNLARPSMAGTHKNGGYSVRINKGKWRLQQRPRVIFDGYGERLLGYYSCGMYSPKQLFLGPILGGYENSW